MRRAALIVVAAVLYVVSGSSPAQAGVGWCKSDPVLNIGGHIADTFVSAPLTAPTQVTGPTQIIVTIPEGVNAALEVSDLGFGYGEQVTVVSSPALRATS